MRQSKKLQSRVHKFYCPVVVFLISGTIYYTIEVVWKTLNPGSICHWSMFVLAGIIGVIASSMNNLFSMDMPFEQQVIYSSFVAILGEYITGMIVNVKLGLNVWDYSGLPGTFANGQCNVFFCIAWVVILALIIPLLDWIEWKIGCEEKPYYIVFGHLICMEGKGDKNE